MTLVLHADVEARPKQWTFAGLSKVTNGSVGYSEGHMTNLHILGPTAGLTLLPPTEGSWSYSDNPHRFGDFNGVPKVLADLTDDGPVLEPVMAAGRPHNLTMFVGPVNALAQIFTTADGTRMTLAHRLLRLTGHYDKRKVGTTIEIRLASAKPKGPALITRSVARYKEEPWRWSCILMPINVDLDSVLKTKEK